MSFSVLVWLPSLDFHIALWQTFLFYPLPCQCHPSSFARPSPFVLLCHFCPPYPLFGWRNLWIVPYTLQMVVYLVPEIRRLLQIIGYFSCNYCWIINVIHLAIVSSAFITPFNLLIDNDKPGYNFYTTSYKTTSKALFNKLEEHFLSSEYKRRV